MQNKLSNSLKKNLKDFWEDALDTIFPLEEVCMYCNKRVHTYKHYLCRDCYQNLEEIDYAYLLPVYSEQHPLKMISAYAMDEESGKALYDYKLNRQRGLSFAFSSMLIDRLENGFDISAIDAIVPIPSSKDRLNLRGFDHVADITKKIAEYFEIEHLELLNRGSHKLDQKNLTRKERLENVYGAFAIKKINNLPTTVLLVDDVVTTGATMASAEMELRRLGIEVFCASVFHKK